MCPPRQCPPRPCPPGPYIFHLRPASSLSKSAAYQEHTTVLKTTFQCITALRLQGFTEPPDVDLWQRSYRPRVHTEGLTEPYAAVLCDFRGHHGDPPSTIIKMCRKLDIHGYSETSAEPEQVPPGLAAGSPVFSSQVKVRAWTSAPWVCTCPPRPPASPTLGKQGPSRGPALQTSRQVCPMGPCGVCEPCAPSAHAGDAGLWTCSRPRLRLRLVPLTPTHRP